MAKKTTTTNKKKVVKVDANGQLHVHSTFNNVIVTLANSEGQVISWSSAGKMGFRGSKKNTPYAAQTAASDCAKVAFDLGLRKVKAYVKGPGSGREAAIRTVNGAGIDVIEIVDVTPLPHNGCRPKGRRRV
jgi:small subunit ribosomal protein S11